MADPAAIVPLIPGGPPFPPNQTTYSQYYQDDSHDNAEGNYAAIMSIFAVPVAGDAPAPALVTESVYASAVTDPQAFITLVVDNVSPEGRVCMFHRLQRFAPQLGVMTGLDNKGHAFFGDVVEGQMPATVEWPANAFHQAGGVTIRVPTREVIDQMLGADPGIRLLGPFGNDDAGTEVIRVRYAMLLPFRYVRILLPRPLTPREAWIQLAGAIYTDRKQEACAPLIDWLRAALTRQADGLASRVQLAEHPRIPLMLPTLVKRRWQLVLSDLPALSPGATLVAGTAIATSLNALVTDNREFRLADELRREQEKTRTPEKCFGRIGVLKLLRLCHVTNASELPEMWQSLAAEPRRQDGIMTIQQAFNGTAQSLGMFGVHIPSGVQNKTTVTV
jgi:hypothetical protein